MIGGPLQQHMAGFGAFCQGILYAADPDTDFSRFENDGLHGVLNTGDDDGVVDAVFLLLFPRACHPATAEVGGGAPRGIKPMDRKWAGMERSLGAPNVQGQDT